MSQDLHYRFIGCLRTYHLRFAPFRDEGCDLGRGSTPWLVDAAFKLHCGPEMEISGLQRLRGWSDGRPVLTCNWVLIAYACGSYCCSRQCFAAACPRPFYNSRVMRQSNYLG